MFPVYEALAGLCMFCFALCCCAVWCVGEFHDWKYLKIRRYHVSSICNAALTPLNNRFSVTSVTCLMCICWLFVAAFLPEKLFKESVFLSAAFMSRLLPKTDPDTRVLCTFPPVVTSKPSQSKSESESVQHDAERRRLWGGNASDISNRISIYFVSSHVVFSDPLRSCELLNLYYASEQCRLYSSQV